MANSKGNGSVRNQFSTGQILQALADAGGVATFAARALGVPENTLSNWVRKEGLKVDDLEIIETNVKLAKRSQAAQDHNRIANKSFREHARVDNALEAWMEKIYAELPKLKKPIVTKKHKDAEGYAGIVQLSDVHFNEIVADVAGNKYDFHIAGKRLRQHIMHATRIFKAYDVKQVYLCLTADMYNSDRRLDELLANSTNRAKGFLLGCDILTQLILDLNQHFNVVVASVCGNEARLDMIREFGDIRATNNFDFMLHEFLQRMFKGCKGVKFINGDPTELVININGNNILLVHGDSRYAGDPFKGTLEMMAKYSAVGIQIRYVLSGHIHMAYVSDYFARSGSTVGNNAYSHKALNLTGRASQNCYLVAKTGNIHSIKVDLQECGHIEGYDVTDQLIAYNAKSAQKCHTPTTIHEIVI